MLKNLKRQGPALVIAMVALFAALGGTSYAKKKLGLGALNAVAKINTVGSGPITYQETQAIVPSTGPLGLNVASLCPPNTFPVGGGIRVNNDADMFVNDSHPITGGWGGTVFNNGNLTRTATVTAVCTASLDAGAPTAAGS